MTHDIIPSETTPPQTSQSLGAAGALMAATGAGLMVLTMLGSAGVATVWAFGKLLGFRDWLVLPFYAITGVAVLWATVWTTGRAWHVEKLLMQGKDIDPPVFKLLHYFRKDAGHGF